MSSYIELHTASAFSFLQGASLPEALVDRAADLGYSSIALLDRDGVYGAPRFHKAARAAGVRPIIGAELTIEGAGGAGKPGVAGKASGGGRPGQSFALPLLCESAEGYRNLCRLITRMKLRAPKGEGALTLDELEGMTGGLIALAGRAALHGAMTLAVVLVLEVPVGERRLDHGAVPRAKETGRIAAVPVRVDAGLIVPRRDLDGAHAAKPRRGLPRVRVQRRVVEPRVHHLRPRGTDKQGGGEENQERGGDERVDRTPRRGTCDHGTLPDIA